MLRVITLNLNGIRSAVSKGFLDWLVKQKADCVCMQEIRAQQADLSDAILMPNGLHAHFACAERKGYAG
ncbi:MAG: exodeoxyribonuclease III, partial [Burkholderiales bacterium]|nr:exodeoxyribonuclease III [Burkholderiales bacterium]